MKVLILSCDTGEGHNSSAKAIKAELDRQGIQCDVRDTLALVSEATSRNVSDIYVYTTKKDLFGKVYRLGEMISEANKHIKSPVNYANRFYSKDLHELIINGEYDVAVCTHLFPAEALTDLREKGLLQIPTLFVMTDYTCIPFLKETKLDRYVIPHEDLIEEFAEKGMDRSRLVPVGIPVNEELFSRHIPKMEARRQLEDMTGWEASSEDDRWFLVMGGSMGFGNMESLLNCLLDKIRHQDRIICVCGRNTGLENKLREEFEFEPRIRTLGFTDKVSLLMDASEVLFSKPGGITSTEAAVKNIPLVHTAPIPGVEDQNARFFHFHNMSYSSLDPQRQAEVAVRLCEDSVWRKRMTDAQKRNANPLTCKQIVGLLKDMTNEK